MEGGRGAVSQDLEGGNGSKLWNVKRNGSTDLCMVGGQNCNGSEPVGSRCNGSNRSMIYVHRIDLETRRHENLWLWTHNSGGIFLHDISIGMLTQTGFPAFSMPKK